MNTELYSIQIKSYNPLEFMSGYDGIVFND